MTKEKLEVGDAIIYRGYTISHPSKPDYVTEIAHDSVKPAQLIKQVINPGKQDAEAILKPLPGYCHGQMSLAHQVGWGVCQCNNNILVETTFAVGKEAWGFYLDIAYPFNKCWLEWRQPLAREGRRS